MQLQLPSATRANPRCPMRRSTASYVCTALMSCFMHWLLSVGEIVSPSEKRNDYRDLKKIGQGFACVVYTICTWTAMTMCAQGVRSGVYRHYKEGRYGGHQADEPAAAAQEGMIVRCWMCGMSWFGAGAHHQRNPGDARQPTEEYCQLPRQLPCRPHPLGTLGFADQKATMIIAVIYAFYGIVCVYINTGKSSIISMYYCAFIQLCILYLLNLSIYATPRRWWWTI